MIKLGIRAHDIGKMSASDLASNVLAFGFDGVQLVFKKALDEEVDFKDVDFIKNAFVKPNIMMLGAYFNPYHPDSEELLKGVSYFKKHLEIARSLNTFYVGTETGSYQGSPWSYHPKNHTDEALFKVSRIIKELQDYADKYNAHVVIEGAYAHVAYSPDRLLEMLNMIDNPNVKVTVDLFNYLNIDNYEERNEIFERSLELFKNRLVIFHLKDFIVVDHRLVQVGLGQGLMDYPYLIKRIKETYPNTYLIFEGVTGDDIITSYDLINQLLRKDV